MAAWGSEWNERALQANMPWQVDESGILPPGVEFSSMFHCYKLLTNFSFSAIDFIEMLVHKFWL